LLIFLIFCASKCTVIVFTAGVIIDKSAFLISQQQFAYDKHSQKEEPAAGRYFILSYGKIFASGIVCMRRNLV